MDLTKHLFFFEDVRLEVAEQDDPANSWQETDHGQHQSMSLIYDAPYFNVLDDHADPTEDEELYIHKVESTFDEQESVLG